MTCVHRQKKLSKTYNTLVRISVCSCSARLVGEIQAYKKQTVFGMWSTPTLGLLWHHKYGDIKDKC